VRPYYEDHRGEEKRCVEACSEYFNAEFMCVSSCKGLKRASKEGLCTTSGGLIALVVISSVVGLALLVVASFLLVKKFKGPGHYSSINGKTADSDVVSVTKRRQGNVLISM